MVLAPGPLLLIFDSAFGFHLLFLFAIFLFCDLKMSFRLLAIVVAVFLLFVFAFVPGVVFAFF